MPTPDQLQVRRVDFTQPVEMQALVDLLDAYARDPMGGGTPLAEDVKQRLGQDLPTLPHAASFIAWRADTPIGLLNAFEAYSSFKARPLLNVHDLAVHPAHRGQGVGQALLVAAEQHARARGCCKLTLEVLTGNGPALRSYLRFGFAPYALDPAAGQASFMQKWLG